MTAAGMSGRDGSSAAAGRARLTSAAGRFTGDDLDRLVRAAGQDDQAAVARLVHVLRLVVARYCRALLGGRDLAYLSADDVAQDVCAAVLRALPGHRDRGGSFLHLVHAIAADKVADACRIVAGGRFGTGTGQPAALSRLAPLQREILALRIVVGLSVGETAEMLAIPAADVRAIQHRALAELREALRDC
ncbi:sigma factor-like helix-turn-helix DNA-binding protein [Amycolatopsis panacis]